MTSVTPVPPPDEERVREEAARWTVRRDRGLSAAEAIEFELWLAADERHAAAMRRTGQAWHVLDRIPDDVAATVAAEVARRRWWKRMGTAGLAAAASLAVAFFVGSSRTESAAEAVIAVAREPQLQQLSDGSIVRLNAGGAIAEVFTAEERSVTLVRGEAHFTVMKEAERPFVVRAGKVEVRAVGTAFNVRLHPDAVSVVVTEGQVSVAAADVVQELPVLVAGQRLVIALVDTPIEAPVAVTELAPQEVAAELAWQEPLLRLGGATLADLAREFRRRGGQQLILADISLAELQVGGRFRADDIDGFVRVLEENYGVHSQRQPDGSIVLRLMPQ